VAATDTGISQLLDEERAGGPLVIAIISQVFKFNGIRYKLLQCKVEGGLEPMWLGAGLKELILFKSRGATHNVSKKSLNKTPDLLLPVAVQKLTLRKRLGADSARSKLVVSRNLACAVLILMVLDRFLALMDGMPVQQ